MNAGVVGAAGVSRVPARLDTIVVVVDPAQQSGIALERAVILANASHASHVAVVPMLPLRLSAGIGRAARRQWAGALTDRLAHTVRASATRVSVLTPDRSDERGDTMRALCAEADLLVFGDRLSTMAGRLLGGWSVGRALRERRKPVLVVKRKPVAPYRRALVALDVDASARRVLSATALLAPHAGVHVVHAHWPAYESKLSYAGVSDELIEKYRRSEQIAALDRVSRALIGGGTPEHVRAAVVHGDAARGVLKRADSLGADLIVTGNRRKTVLDRVLAYSVSRRIMSASPVDVAIWPD